MEPSYFAGRPLVPRKRLDEDQHGGSSPERFSASKVPEVSKRARVRRPKEASKTDEEWEAIKDPFCELYVKQGFRLEDVMRRIEETHRFKAS